MFSSDTDISAQGRTTSFASFSKPVERLNPRPDGPLDFPPPDGGGVFEHPCLSRLLRIVEQNGKRRSKARKKSL